MNATILQALPCGSIINFDLNNEMKLLCFSLGLLIIVVSSGNSDGWIGKSNVLN